jgi:hypothetical protein
MTPEETMGSYRLVNRVGARLAHVIPSSSVSSTSLVSAIVAVVGLLIAVVGSVAGLGSYVLYSADLIDADASADLILLSVLSSLIAAPIGFIGERRAKRRRERPVLAQAGMILALGTLGVWVLVVAAALGK